MKWEALMKRTMKQFWRTLVALVFAAALLSGSLPALADDGEQSLPDWTGEVAVAGKNLAADVADELFRRKTFVVEVAF